MSKWIENFNSHQFHSTWDELKNNLEVQEIDDHTDISSTQELARLKKLITYVDGMISALDPELLPSDTLENCQSRASACLNSLQKYSSNRSTVLLVEANNYANDFLLYIKPFVIIPKEQSKVLRRAFNSYARTVKILPRWKR